MPTPAPASSFVSEIRRKELGYVSHFLDAVWDDLGKVAAFAVGVAGISGYAAGEIAPWILPAAMLAGMIPAAGGGLSRLLDARRMAEAHDSPAVQDFIGRVGARATGAVASQRGTVWIVRERGEAQARVMGEREYARFKREIARSGVPLDEVVIRRGEASLKRTVGGLPDPGGRDLPAAVRLDTGTGALSRIGWFLKGMPSTPAAVAKAAAVPAYSASRFLSGGSGLPPEAPAAPVRAPVRPAYSSTRFLSEGTGYEDGASPRGPGR